MSKKKDDKRTAKKILYVIQNGKDAQFRYRVKNTAEALGSLGWSSEWTRIRSADKKNLDEFDLVVVVRQTDKDGNIKSFINKAHRAGKKVVFDLDDLVFDYKNIRVLMKGTNSKNFFYWMGYIWGVRRIAKKVDGFICTNQFLAKKLKRCFKKPVKVVRNSLNQRQIEVSDENVKNKTIRKNSDKWFRIGYFSGSPTHAKDFAMVESELIRFLEKHENTKLRVVGYMVFSGRMQELIDAGWVELGGVANYLRLQKLIAEVDVNIAPLVINDFTNCKSELKFFEAAAVETTTIASPTYAFRKAIEDGENGFLAKPGDWYDKLEFLYNNPMENRKIAGRAKEYALKHYYGKEFVKEVEEAYGYFAK